MKNRKRILIALSIIMCVVSALCFCACVGVEISDECSHEWSEWKTKTSDSCTVDELKNSECFRCGEVEENVISATEHTESDWIVDEDATCTQAGSKHKECTVCGVTLKTEEIEKIEHSYTTSVVTNPTCTEQGYTTHICECGDSYVDSYVEAFGHDLVRSEAQDSTYTGATVGTALYVQQEQIFTTSNGTITGLTTYGKTLSTITIPSLIDNTQEITAIGDSAFNLNTTLTSVTISEGIKTIEAKAFANCTGLTSITIPSSVASIGDSAFIFCTGLTSITIPSSVTSIGDSAFIFCTGLTSITIPSSVTSIGKNAFANCTGLTSITIPSSVTSIGSQAFGNCSNLTEINYNVKEIEAEKTGSNVFYNAGASRDGIKVTIGDSVESIPAYLFRGCTKFTSIRFGKNVTSIGDFAFYECTALTEIVYDAKSCVISSSGAFQYAGASGDGITITFGDNVKIIPSNLFKSTVSTGTPNVTSVIIGNKVTSIGDYAFYACAGLKSVTIGEGVTSIGSCAFRACTGLTEINYNAIACTDLTSTSNVFYNAGTAGTGITVTFGSSVESIPACLFHVSSSTYAPKVTFVTIGNYCTKIGKTAFQNCSNLTSITLGQRINSIGYGAFYGCTALTEINYNIASLETALTANSNVFYNAGTLGSGITATFGNSVQSIPAYLFYGSSSTYAPKVTSVTIGANVTSIGDFAFYCCSGLSSITIPAGITSIGTYAFGCCTGLTEINYNAKACADLTNASSVFYKAGTNGEGITVTFGDSVISVPAWLFYTSSLNLTSVKIGANVTSIGSYAFYACSNLTSITFEDTSTWYRTTSSADWSNKTGGTETDVTNASTNATYFKSTYYDSCWYKL